MLFFYNLSIQLYKLAIILLSPLNKKARLWRSGRKNLFQKLQLESSRLSRPVWIHAASLGEFEQGRPLIDRIKKKYPDKKILLTFFSPSGFEVRKHYQNADYVTYLPLDTAANARLFVDQVVPGCAIFIKYEVWYHLYSALQRRGIPTLLISSSFRPGQWYFWRMASSVRRMLMQLDHIFVQDRDSLDLLKKYHFNNVSYTGDTRVDRVLEVARTVSSMPELANMPEFDLVAGSTWPEDEKVLARLLNSQGISALIAPHDVRERRIQQLVKLLGSRKPLMRLSELLVSPPKVYPDIVVVDSIGLLSGLYTKGKIAYVGGGFGQGIHNILEPAAHLKPVLFGPRYKKFREAHNLIRLGAAFPVQTAEECFTTATRLLEKSVRKNIAGILEDYLHEEKGATDQILAYLEKTGNLSA